jgi:anti-sigma B factor antagonist
MNYSIVHKEKIVIISTESEKLIAANAPELKTEFVNLNKEGHKNIIVDMSKTRYCDSSGLSALLVGNRLCKASNGSFLLCNLQDMVVKLLGISKLNTIINSTPTLNEAMEYIFMEEVEREFSEE